MPDRLEPTRILNVIRFPIGGIRSYLRYTYSRFDPRVYAATVVTVDRPEARLLAEGMAPIQADLHTVSERRALLGLTLATNTLLRGGTIGLIHSQGTTAAIVSDLSARRYGVPHVVTLHETFRADQFSGVMGAAKRKLLSRVFSRAEGVVTVSRDACENLLQHVPLSPDARSRVQVIRNGVAVDIVLREASAAPPALRAKYALGDDVVLLGFVGRFMPEKGFGVLIDAVHRLVQNASGLPKFVVVAVNDGAFVREYRERVTSLGLDPVFRFTGFQASAAGTLAELDAVVMPSLREACPLVAMEAMVLGCPLVASDCLGLRELTVGSPALTSVAGDPDSLAASLRGLCESRAAARERALAHRAAAREAFDSSRAAGDLASLFERARSSTGRAVAHAMPT